MTRICGILSWWDESPSWLAVAVQSMGRFCDHVVAVDGAYALTPGARPRSMPEQAEAIQRAAEAADVGLTLHQPKDVFRGNEVEKRNLTLKLAGAVLEPEDWVCIVDSDQYLMKCNPEAIRSELSHTEKIVARYTVLNGMDPLADDKLASIARLEEIDQEWTTQISCMYRWHPTLTYGPMHWSLSRRHDGRPVWLWGAPPNERCVDTVDLGAGLVFYHRTNDRSLKRKTVQEGYYATRDIMRIEEWEGERDSIPVG